MNRSRLARAALLCPAVFCLALLCLASDDGSVTSDRRELLDGSRDRVLRRAFIPSDRNVHGEVRLIRRGEAWVLQTLIQSPQLRRGVQRMRKQELYSWPAGEPGHEDSTRYLEDLEAARDRALAAFEQRDDRSQRAQQMLIELILGPRDALWGFYEVEIGHHGSELVIEDKEPISVRPTSRTYLRRAFRLQAEAGFDGPVAELTQLPP